LGLQDVSPYAEQDNGDGQRESARSGTAGVHIEHAVSLHDGWSMSMAAYDGPKTGCSRIQVEFVEIVKDIERDFFNLDDLRLRKAPCPFASVDIPSNGNDRCDRSQRLQHPRFSDVSCVDYPFGAFESLDDLRSHETVGVRDDTNEAVKHSAL
jgi:hypothetical protein